MKKLLILLTLGAIIVPVLVFSGSFVTAAIPHLINYQGMLTDNSGNPLSGTYSLTFRIYDDSTTGNLEWGETQSGVQVDSGLFNVILGQATALNLAFDEQYWLEVQVGTSDTMPRLRFTSVGYAYRAQAADTAYNLVSAGYAQVFTVALSGGDFTTINGALNSCVNPASNNTYLIRVMPGVYNESVVCSSFVRLQGAGKYVSYITGSVTGADSCTIDGFNIADGILCSGTSPTITHNIITSSANGIWITNGGKPWIKENEIVDCVVWGIYCDGWGTDAWIIANKIERNGAGGIRCTNSSPTISNNQILENYNYGIYLVGQLGTPSEPTIDDNVIGRTHDPDINGIGIYMTDYAEPRIIANDIWVNYIGIEIRPSTQPSILANNINYNNGYGIRCYSSGFTKPVVIEGNHIHSNPTVGLDIFGSTPIVTHNNITDNDPGGVNPDIRYDAASAPMISLNVFDIIAFPQPPPGTATGMYNVTSLGLAISPF